MPQELLSLREIGRRLGIPPSSVAYYKDRFTRFIPAGDSYISGKRAKYPSEALSVFKEIRTMFENNYSAEQIERELSLHVEPASRRDRNKQQENNGPPIGTALPEIRAALGAVSGILENQALFRAEIDSLRREIVELKREKQSMQEQYQEKIGLLEKELGCLRQERADMVRMLLDEIHGTPGDKTIPPAPLLAMPLVIRSRCDEYLGVAGKGKHFSLGDFLVLIEKSGCNDRTVTTSWRREEGRWRLSVVTWDPERAERHEHLLVVEQTVTPSHNNVVELTDLTIDGTEVPHQFLLVLFRKIRDEFDAGEC